jgi:hypothetical protein
METIKVFLKLKLNSEKGDLMALKFLALKKRLSKKQNDDYVNTKKKKELR